MSSNTDYTITATQVQTGIKPWKPLTFDKDDVFHYCVGGIATSPPIRIAWPDRSGDEEHLIKTNMLHSAEKKLIERSFVDFALKNAGVEVFAEVTKTRVLVKAEEASARIPEFAGKKYSAIVFAWKEKSYPPECMQKQSEGALFSTKFTKIHHHHDDGTGRGLRFHWSRVEIHEYDDKYTATNVLQDQRDALCRATENQEINLYHAPLGFNTELVKLKDIIKHVGEYMQPEKSHWKEIIRAILQKEFASEDLVVHGTKHYDIRYDPTALQHGLRFCIGKNRQISLNSIEAADPYPLLQELPVAQLFMEPITVADFVWWQKKLVRGLYTEEELDQTLRGKNVRVMTPLGRVECQIRSVSGRPLNSFDREDVHPAYRGRKGANLEYPDYPTINIGSKGNPVMVPAEHCYILPWQTFKHPEQLRIPLDKLHIVGGVRNGVRTLGGQNVQEVLVSLGDDGMADVAKYNVKKHIHEQMLSGGSVVFIEASIAGSTFEIFASFRQAIKKDFLSTFAQTKLQIDDSWVLSLTYEPGKDPTSMWTAQLKRLRKELGLAGKDVMAVVIVGDDEHHSDIYQALKYVCDIKIGFQTCFVKHNILEQKAANNPQDGVDGAAHEMARRITTRNPPKASTFEAVDLQDLVVAVHVSEFTVKVPTLDKSGNCTSTTQKRYLVVFSSRHATESKCYACEPVLLNESEIQTFSLAGKCYEFLRVKFPGSLKKDARLTILRSGYLPRFRKPEDKPLVVSTKVHRFTNIKAIGSYTLEAPELADPCEPEAVESQPLTEKQLLDEDFAHFKNVAGWDEVKLSYIYLVQDKDFLFSQDTKAKITAAVAESSSKTDHMFFITENKVMNPASNVIRAHRQVHIKGDSTLIKLTLLGYPFSEQNASVGQGMSEKASSIDGVQPYHSEMKPSTQADQQIDSSAQCKQGSDSSTRSHESSSFVSTDKPKTDSGYGSITTASSPEKKAGMQTKADSAYASNTAASSPEKKSAKQTPAHLSQETLESLARRLARLETERSPPVPISPPPAPTQPQETIFVGGVTREGTFTTPAEVPEQLQRRLDEQVKSDEIALREFHAQTSSSQSVVSEEELVRLAKMWKDDRLNLHNTKWPVPTYLAYLAAKRAQFHLQFGWDKKDGDDDEDVATCTLPKVHDQVKDSLYFL